MNMKIWTANRDWSGKFLPIVNSFVPQYGGFDYRVSKTNTQEVEVVAECEAAVRWLSSIGAGVQSSCEEMREEGDVFWGIKISITSIYGYDGHTTDKVMYFRGRSFFRGMKEGFLRESQLDFTEIETD